jgi:anti-sigma B factor antagonist
MFVVTETEDAQTLVLRGEGELDVATVHELRGLFEQAATSSVASVLVDLTGVAFIDSAGIGVLDEGHRGLTAAGKQLVVRVSSAATLRVFEVSGMDRYLTLEQVAA